MSFVISQPSSKKEFEQYYHLRWKILRQPWGQVEGTEKDDIENQCFHVMAMNQDNEVIGAARLQFNSRTEAQIRYMAVAEKFTRKGVGKELVNALEQHAKSASYKIITLDAREPAVGFYKKLEYKIVKKSYLLFDVIQHYKMQKKIR